MTPLMFLEQWRPILPIVAAGLAIATFMALTILATRYLTNERWRKDLLKNMPANVREQLGLRDQQIEQQARELMSLRERVQAQDVALRAVRQITWEGTFRVAPAALPYPQMRRKA
jgi:hypothetical protein